MEGNPKSCTITRDGDQWYASIICEVNTKSPQSRTSPVVGIDRGITNYIADSDGTLIQNPKFFRSNLASLARVQRIHSRRTKGSNRREKAKLRVMRLHRKVRRQREHFLHGLSAQYTKNHGVIVIENLNINAMARNHCLALSVFDASWGMFATQLKYKSEWSGGQVVEVPAHYSSQTCSSCQRVAKESRVGEKFCCVSCGYTDHADLNAAKVLKQRWESLPLKLAEAYVTGQPVNREEGSFPQITEIPDILNPSQSLYPQEKTLNL